MRFHIVAGIYVMLFSMFYSFSPTQYAVLVLLITSVMELETVNTCVATDTNLLLSLPRMRLPEQCLQLRWVRQ